MPTVHWSIATDPFDLALCFQLRMERQRSFSEKHRHLSTTALYNEQRTDPADTMTLPNGQPRAYTVLITIDGEPTATCRFCIARTSDYPNLEAVIEIAEAYDISSALDKLGLLTDNESSLSLVEFGRLAIRHKYRTTCPEMIYRAIKSGAYHVGCVTRTRYFVTITLPVIARAMSLAGVKTQKLGDLTPRYQQPEAVRYLMGDAGYHFPQLLKQYPQLADPKFAERESYETLVAMMGHESPAICLFWGDLLQHQSAENDFVC